MPRAEEYWLPGYGLSRHIVIGQINYFLGPSATVRPYSYQGREGYLINGPKLTREQIDDLALLSRDYEQEEAARMTGQNAADVASGQSKPYINELVHPRKPEPRRGR